jgi:RNA polymerase sigma-70 factor (ECF subfamily)
MSIRTDLAALDAAPLVFADVYAEYFPFVYRVVARLTGGGDVEDLVQEVFLVVHRRLSEFRSEARLTTWLFRIAYRTVGAHVRRERLRRRLRELFVLSPAEPAAPETASDALDRARRVRRALEQLTYAERSALVLFEVEGMSAAELADAFGVPIGTIYRRLHDARRAFAAHYGASQSEEPA